MNVYTNNLLKNLLKLMNRICKLIKYVITFIKYNKLKPKNPQRGDIRMRIAYKI